MECSLDTMTQMISLCLMHIMEDIRVWNQSIYTRFVGLTSNKPRTILTSQHKVVWGQLTQSYQGTTGKTTVRCDTRELMNTSIWILSLLRKSQKIPPDKISVVNILLRIGGLSMLFQWNRYQMCSRQWSNLRRKVVLQRRYYLIPRKNKGQNNYDNSLLK